MSQGIFVETRTNWVRPRSKKQIKEIATENPERVVLERTSVFNNEESGALSDLPEGTYFFVGPDPYKDRKFYGQIRIKNGKITVT
jgi:hypothetical protein